MALLFLALLQIFNEVDSMSKLKKLSPLFLLGILTFAGCTTKEVEPDPSTIPNIPPSTRGAGGGGPGAEGGAPAGGAGKAGKLEPPTK